jgi:methane/ammonia monooxygenase subunit B
MRRRLLFAVLLGLGLMIFSAPAAFAHGEHSQEPWLRLSTVAFWNTTFSAQTVQQGQELTITGTAKVLETWPKTLPDPETAFINVESPGPAFLMKDRVINGQEAPASFYIERGGVYDFKLTLVGRVPGTYHVHPTFAVRSAGTLIGPGQYIRVTKSAAGFTNPVQLYNGKTVNLESYGLGWPVMGFSVLTFALGMVWLLWWIVPKPTVSRLAVTSQLSVNDDGGDAVGLVTRRDHRAMNLIMLAAVLLLAGGWIWQATAFKTKIPQQVDRFRIASAPQPATFATATLNKITYDRKARSLTMDVQAVNQGKTPMELRAVHFANLVFLPGAASSTAALPGADGTYEASPSGPVAAGATQNLTLTIRGRTLKLNDLVPTGTANSNMTSVLEFADSSGTGNFVTVQQFLTPIFD